MKKLKFDHQLVEEIIRGSRRTTWRLFDDKDLSVNDKLLIIDKVDKNNPDTWHEVGIAVIDEVVEKRMGDIDFKDMDTFHNFESNEALINHFRSMYGRDVDKDTSVKIIKFTFSKSIDPDIPDQQLHHTTPAVVVYTDGGSRGNPGPSAGGYVIFDDHEKVLVHKGIYLGITTNNQAEYTALKLALEEAKRLGALDVKVYMDSLLVVNQMKGIFKVKNRDLWPIHDSVKQLCRHFKHVSFTQVPRAFNKLADEAVNQALDKHLDVIHVGLSN